MNPKQFTGTLNNADVPVSNLSYSAGTYKGFHLLGNPFTSAIKWNDGNWGISGIAANAKIWNDANSSYSEIAGNGIIPALNGFMVEVTSGTNSLTIPLAARTHDATGWYKSSDNPSIMLVAHDPAGQTAQESIIGFDNGATAGFDPAFDSHFLGGYAPKFYSVAGSEQLSTNTLPEAGGAVQVPFSFIKNDRADFTIEAKTISNISGPVILNDLKTNTTQDLSVNPVYTFTSASGDSPDRFLLKFSHVGIGETQSKNVITIYASGNQIFVTGNGGNISGNIFVYNMMGQLIQQQNLGTANLTKINFSGTTGYYLVKVITGENAYTGKVFIN